VGDERKASEQWLSQRKILEHDFANFSDSPTSREYTILVDALFGVGLSREVEGDYASAIRKFNELRGYKLALDVPSGICSDTGRVLGIAVKADETVTFGFAKRGLYLYPGCEYAGRVQTADVGINAKSFLGETPGMFYLDEIRDFLPPRQRSGNKGTFGKVLLIAGSAGMAGAAVLSAKSAYRTGAGMVKVVTAPENRVILQETVPEVLFGTYDNLEESLAWADVAAIGPGLGQSEEARRCMETVLRRCEKPLLIDADGLNLLAQDEELQHMLAAQERQVVLTPHVGELARLTGISVTQLKERLWQHGLELAEKLHVIVVAKDARTFTCAQNHPVCMNIHGNSGMATAGSGDVLAGIIAGLWAQGGDGFEAACLGVRLHAAAGDKAVQKIGSYACMAGDIADEISTVLMSTETGEGRE
jgi:NAD(P)H-hydrate epimerase